MHLLDHPAIASRYFFPRYARLAEPHLIDVAPGVRLACHRTIVDPAAPTVVYFHGNGEVVADYVPAFPAWMRHIGCNLLLAEYRGYGMSTGEPALSAMLDDVAKVIDGIPDDRLVLFGRSVGSLFALHGAKCRPNAAALIVESGIFDLAERVRLRVSAADLGVSEGALGAAIAERFDPTAILAGYTGRTLVLHTLNDEMVGVAHARRLFAAAPEPKALHLFERGGHNDILAVNQAAYVAAVETVLAAVR